MSMGVYLPNMEMPTSCRKCMISQPDGYGWICPIIENKPIVDGRVKSRYPHCPLFPVPPHGRCIDADALAEKHRELAYELRGANYDFHMTAKAWVDSAPTIITAGE